MSKFEVNFKRLAALLLPTFWRRPMFAAITYAIIAPFSYLHTRFILFRRESNYRLTHNGQVCYLRAVLNDQFDPIERRITIDETGENMGVLPLYQRVVDKAVIVPMREKGYAKIINLRSFIGVNGCDFFISVPFDLLSTVDESRLKAIVNSYKLVSKTFTINYK